MFDYNPEEAKRTIDPGVYEAILEATKQKTSRAGKEMIELELRVFGPRELHIRDYIVQGKAIWKLEQLAVALGAREEFAQRTFDPGDYVGRRVSVGLTVKESEQYGQQNSISAYARSDGKPIEGMQPAQADDEDPLPF